MRDAQPMTPATALQLLRDLGAPTRLLRHVELVGEAADALLAELTALGVVVDGDFVRAGVILHDVGKIVHGHELTAPGALHESAGEALLLARGVPPELARVCRSHAQWATMGAGFEELVIALADALWKGARRPALEERVIAEAAARRGVTRWELFVALDSVFEAIAADGDARLARSASPGW